jgi:glycosyltransferase involved in cell wall biosynthesis
LKELEKFIKETKLLGINLLGSMPRIKVFEILKKSDIFVLISDWEGFPYTILEAMSCGLAIIASDVGGTREAINNECGILVKRKNQQEIKHALETLLKNPSLIKEMGINARERLEKEFSLDKMLRETEQVYKKVVPFMK